MLYAGFDAVAVEKAQAKIKDFRAWIEARRSELTALQAIYAGTRPLRLSLKEQRQLRDALAVPPLAATPAQLWRAFEAAEPHAAADAEPARRAAGEVPTDLVQLVRHAIHPVDVPLQPYAEEVRMRYAIWKAQKRAAGAEFAGEKEEWLDRMAEHIATSLAIEPEDFETGWFGQHGSLGRAHALFGDQFPGILAELNEKLAA